MSLVEISNLSAHYLQRGKKVRAVDEINLQIESDEILGMAQGIWMLVNPRY